MRRWLGRAAIYAAALGVLLVFLAPIAWMIDISLKTRAEIFVWPPKMLAFTPTFANYRTLFATGLAFPRFLLNSVGVALAATALTLVVGLPAAYALVGKRLRYAPAVRAGVLLFRMIPPVVRAAITASAIFAVLTSWNEFLFAVTLSRLETQTVPVAVAGFIGDVYVSWGQLAAATVLGLLRALALAFLGQRWLLVGMGPGAVK